MKKIYLKYDDIKPCVECDYGFAKEIIYLGFLYPYKKGDFKYFSIILLLELSISILIAILTPVLILYKIILILIMIITINILFAFNYNLLIIEKLLKEGYYPVDFESSDELIKKGIYFRLQ